MNNYISKKKDNHIFYPNVTKNKNLFPSSKKYKKYLTYHNNKKVYFGDNRYEHYKDRLGYFKDLNHNDNERRSNYRKRHRAITDKDNNKVYLKMTSPSYYSYKYLW